MQVAGKTWGITAEDLIAFAKDYDIPTPKSRLQRICDAVARWPSFARMAGVAQAGIDNISQAPAWVGTDLRETEAGR